ncbi:Protein CIT-1.1 b [Aphelenchoides avenae]|nr:Protein CIT-1.1 b [Aphelenchus avenae]
MMEPNVRRDRDVPHVKPKWYFTKEELARIPSIRDGLDAKEELKLRQRAAGFIQDMGNRLNQGLRDTRSRISQLCMCSAMIYMHRFFVIHSFKKFDARDVAAACLFLAGKSEECPRKLDHVVRAWLTIKLNTDDKQIERETLEQAADYLVLLESVILQTIAFDLLITLPHPIVLNAMEKLVRGDKRQTETAYWFATDLLYTTNWCVRYPVNTLAVLCIQLACTWAQHKIPQNPGQDPWYKQVDPHMTEELLLELTDEFTIIYRECDQTKMMAIKKFADKNRIPLGSSHTKLPSIAPSPASPSPTLPPPPPPPSCLPAVVDEVKPEPKMRRLGLNEYRQRQIQASGSATSTPTSSSSNPPSRQSFMPDYAKAALEGVPEVTLPPEIALATVKSEKVKVEISDDMLPVKQEVLEPVRQSSSQKYYKSERHSGNGSDPSRSRHQKSLDKRSQQREKPPQPPPMTEHFMPHSPPPPPPPPEPPVLDLEDGELQ